MLEAQLPSRVSYLMKAEIINHNYQRILGTPLYFPDNLDSVVFYDIWNADVAIVAHGKEEDPLFNFANKKALDLFETSYMGFIGTLSRDSADPSAIMERIQLFNKVNRNGFVKDYSGVRISAKGNKFMICDTVIFNLFDFDYKYCGQASVISKWSSYIDL